MSASRAHRILAGAVAAAAVVLAPGLARAACHRADFSQAAYQVGESAGSVTITVQRDGPVCEGSVDYATEDGTAKAGLDYQSASGSLGFEAGETTKTFTVKILGDTTDEPAESFTVKFTGSSGGVTAPGGPATVSIADDDPAQPPPPAPPPRGTPATSSPAATSVSPTPATATPSPPGTTPTPTASSPTPQAQEPAGESDGGFPAGVVVALVAVAAAAAAAGWWRLRRRT